MARIPLPQDSEPAPRARVRVVKVKPKARFWAMSAPAVGACAGLVVLFLAGEGVVSTGLWMAAAVALPVVACAAVSLFFYRTEEAQQRRVFD